MWRRLSFRTQLFLPLGASLLAALILGGILLQIFAPGQVADEHEPARRSIQTIAAALNSTLRASDNPQKTLDAFVQSLDASTDIQFRRMDGGPPPSPKDLRNLKKVPQWFVNLITIPEMEAAFPIVIDGRHVGDIVFFPDISADLFEKWIGFLALTSLVAVLMVLTGTVAYVFAGSALRPLQHLGDGLTRIRRGDYARPIPVGGPPEIRQSCEEANALAATLAQLSQDNRDLMHRLVSLQDDERRDLARELHDELGPLLFSIRAGTIALTDASEPTGHLGNSAQDLLQSVEALQQTNRRILDRLRPLYIEELGLSSSVQTLLRNFRKQAPHIVLTDAIDRDLSAIGGPLAQTVYRVIQEALTNVLRHANAGNAHVQATVADKTLVVEISDDGGGFPADNVFGRGLTGMHERVRALSGSLSLLRVDDRTYVRCRLPAETMRDVPSPG
ncbi:histidine kinase [Bradyrhizobium sp. IC3069]|uniref:histidine kinase n=1 Tax=Bradyrhizobium TaxID=374 RepID=UPI001CD79CA1|nr:MULTISPECIES: histidine kinase [Bradyrhizobium]MCA1363674.1 histidine kinase [Bradyrhizobium sp. IC4059]MCA1392601.1 histidine kinase [Bradyrhizobium sp. IC3123]MCA1427709.1 histidine kinase [Bradyrhizobium sp. NBAIM16]MCA1506505.1 histidine kinase [Bradyrhizobium sp. NBAIM02]MCA1511276.1 histidine kinase [Bradyrhizobium sp. NBAIM01]